MKAKIYQSATDLIGGTPLLQLRNLERNDNLKARLLAKLEYFNPAGSVKDRVALAIINAAEKSGELQPGGTIIEPTSGNTGVGLAAIAASRGYKMIVVMPESMSEERRRLARAYGARLVLTSASDGMKGAIAKAEELAAATPGSIIAGQFVNPANPRMHFETTGPEIYADTAGQVDILVAGVGTGGTISGAGKYLKERKPSVKVVAVEPAESSVLSGGAPGPHKIQGIGAGFVPGVLDTEIIDEIIRVPSADACATAALIGREEGFLAGLSGGAAVFAALELAKRPENEGKTIVAILPDNGERYLSTGIYEN